MSTWKLLISDSLNDAGKKLLGENIEITDNPSITPDELNQQIGQYDALIIRGRTKVTAEVIENANNLKVIGRAGVGVDNIDLHAAQTKGITVVNAPMSTSDAVAELTLALMLSLLRKIPSGDASMKDGQWNKKDLKGKELRDQTLGIIGLGRIGHSVTQLAIAFGMETLGYDPLISNETIKNRGCEPLSLDDLYARSDIITLHLPLTNETKHLINNDALTKMKPGTYLICTARGGIIDEEALLNNINSGHIAGAALDVFEKEPPGLTPLISHPHVIATPHIGAQTSQAQKRAALHIAEEVLNALNNKPLRWKIV